MTKEPEKYTKEYFVEKGRKGGNKTKEKYGTEHLSKAGKKGAKKKWENKEGRGVDKDI